MNYLKRSRSGIFCILLFLLLVVFFSQKWQKQHSAVRSYYTQTYLLKYDICSDILFGNGTKNHEEHLDIFDVLYCADWYFPFPRGPPIPQVETLERKLSGLYARENQSYILPVPIIVITKNRLIDLMESILSYHRYIGSPFEIIIHDENSTFMPMVSFLRRLEHHNVTIYWQHNEASNIDVVSRRVAATIDNHMRISASEHYVVTDPDCALDNVPKHILQIYKTLLTELNMTVVGAAMRWDDWPIEIRQKHFERHKISPTKAFVYEGRAIYYIQYPVDTTFAMYHRKTKWGRLLKPAIRVLPPYAVRHLDFYYTGNTTPPDMQYYLRNAASFSHMQHLKTRV